MENILAHNNRIDYGCALKPDEGWTTSWAIGTTYSLDLEVMMGVPLALFHGKYLSECTDLANLRADMLDALNRVKERMFVFVHENNIRSQYGYSMLMGFLDQNIWNISVSDMNQNFHPKIWLVRYEKNALDKKQTGWKYRLVVTSRNMTGATDFDIAVSMDSESTDSAHGLNDALIKMTTKLMEHTGRRDIIKQLRNELREVKFLPPVPFTQKAIFWPHTYEDLKSPFIKNDNIKNDKYEELLVISPFIDEVILEQLSARVKGVKPILVSREYELDKCDPDALQKWDCYQWNSMLEDAESYEELESTQEVTNSHGISLHAKIYIVRAKLGRDFNSWNNWFVGSANCTRAGHTKNFEAMLQLKSNEKGTYPKDVLETLLNPNAPLITKYGIKETSTKDDKESEIDKNIRRFLFDFSHLEFKATVQCCEGGYYATNVVFNEEDWNRLTAQYPKVKVTIRLFANDMDKWTLHQEFRHTFKGVYCQQLSTLLRVSVRFDAQHEKNFLLRMPDIQIPEERHGKIMSEILDSEEKLMRYLMFCLDSDSDKDQQIIGKDLPKHHYLANDRSTWDKYSLPIYEKLLLAASRNREALKYVQQNVARLQKAKGKDGKPLLSNEFLKMWNLFSVYAK
jgi:hypothetical protein